MRSSESADADGESRGRSSSQETFTSNSVAVKVGEMLCSVCQMTKHHWNMCIVLNSPYHDGHLKILSPDFVLNVSFSDCKCIHPLLHL